MTELKPYTPPAFSLRPKTFEEGMRFAEIIAKSNFAPKDFRGKPEDIFLTIQFGAELNLAPLQSLQNISIINGRPSIWGDAMLGLIRAHPEFESIVEEPLPGTADERGYKCTIKRKNCEAYSSTFTVADARVAALWGKPGPWSLYPKRMIQLRARGFCLRDVFPDVLKGIITREEAMDYPVVGNSSTVTFSNENISASEMIEVDTFFDVKTGEIVENDDPIENIEVII